MIVVPPLTLTESNLSNYNIAEPFTSTNTTLNETTWNGATSYTAGAVVVYPTTHRKYERLIAGTTATAPNLDVDNWLDIGPTNRWAMFDLMRSNVTTSETGTISVTVSVSTIANSLAILNTNATSIRVVVRSLTGGSVGDDYVTYDKTFNLYKPKPGGWYNFFYSPLVYKPTLFVTDIPPFKDNTATITISNTTTVECGAVVLGKYFDMGYAQLGATANALNFSTMDRNFAGDAQIVQRRSVPKVNMSVVSKAIYIDKLNAIRDQLNAVPAVWSGVDTDDTSPYFESLLILGFYRDFSMQVSNPGFIDISLELEEL